MDSAYRLPGRTRRHSGERARWYVSAASASARQRARPTGLPCCPGGAPARLPRAEVADDDPQAHQLPDQARSAATSAAVYSPDRMDHESDTVSRTDIMREGQERV
jgi:hypothetical protein